MNKNCAIILAAGEGKRMASNIPKVLCEVLFKPMLGWVMDACENSNINDRCVVAGFQAEKVIDFVGDSAQIVLQNERKGTAHAVQCAKSFLEQHIDGNVFVCCGDSPFLYEKTIMAALDVHNKEKAAVTVITANIKNPYGYGRIIRKDGRIVAIVEEKDAQDEEKNICEINSGAYWFCVKDLLDILDDIKPFNNQSEYYLTDAVKLFINSKKTVSAYLSQNPLIAMGANDKINLFKLNDVYREILIEKFMKNGVEFLSLDGVIISPDVKIGNGTKILPGTILKGNTVIGEDCVIGPNSLIEDSTVGNGSIINSTQVYQSQIDNNVKIGPFCHIRPNSTICHSVKIGDFVEVKNSEIGAGTAVLHLTYVGDSDVGKNVNFGCGVVTINYDGVNKHRCKIEDGAFIGCNTNLVAPVVIGKDAYTGAGSTITKNVPSYALGIERGKQSNVDGFSKKKLAGRKLKVKD